ASGWVHFAGFHCNDGAPEGLAKAGVASISEGRGVFPNLTVLENLRVFTNAGNERYADVQERAFARFPRLGERRHQLAGTLSGGERQMLAMCRGFVTDPAILLLDEVSMGLAPKIVGVLYDLVDQFAEDGVAVLLVEQFANSALRVADYAAIMRLGRIDVLVVPGALADRVT